MYVSDRVCCPCFLTCLLQLKPIGECSNIPTGNLYLESNRNESFPYRNESKGGVDIDGDGNVDTKSGSATPVDTPNTGFIATVPLFTSITLAASILFGLLS